MVSHKPTLNHDARLRPQSLAARLAAHQSMDGGDPTAQLRIMCGSAITTDQLTITLMSELTARKTAESVLWMSIVHPNFGCTGYPNALTTITDLSSLVPRVQPYPVAVPVLAKLVILTFEELGSLKDFLRRRSFKKTRSQQESVHCDMALRC